MPVVRWFNKQQRVGGGFGSTQVTPHSQSIESSQRPWAHVHVPPQATVLVYQALAEFWTSYKGPEYDLNVDILLPGRSKPEMYNFNSDSRYTTRTSKVRKGTFVHDLKHGCHHFCWWPSVRLLSTSIFMQIKSINQNVKVTATGKGEAIVKVSENQDAAFTELLLFIVNALISFFPSCQMVSLYYALPKQQDCPHFDLSVQLIPGCL